MIVDWNKRGTQLRLLRTSWTCRLSFPSNINYNEFLFFLLLLLLLQNIWLSSDLHERTSWNMSAYCSFYHQLQWCSLLSSIFSDYMTEFRLTWRYLRLRSARMTNNNPVLSIVLFMEMTGCPPLKLSFIYCSERNRIGYWSVWAELVEILKESIR